MGMVGGVMVARLQADSVDDQQYDAAHDQRRADQPRRLEQHRLDEFVGRRTDHRRNTVFTVAK